MTSPLVSILSSYSAPGAKGSLVVGSGEFKVNDGCTLRTIIDLAGSPDLVKAYRSVMSNRASPRGNQSWDLRHGVTSGFSFLETLSARLGRRDTPNGFPHHPVCESPAPSTS